MIPDARISLQVLKEEYKSCTRCALGTRRLERGAELVFGEYYQKSPGNERPIMFVGEGPGREEEKKGQPFIGRSGQLLRGTLKQAGITNVYITNTVCCRSFSYPRDDDGQFRYYTSNNGKRTIIEQDDPPTDDQRLACRDRLYQEIYKVNPEMIVALGGKAAETLLDRPVKILQESGQLRADTASSRGTYLRLPGVGQRAVFTPGGLWRHKVHKVFVQKTEQDFVYYPVLMVVHPSAVIRNISDNSRSGAKFAFTEGIRAVLRNINTYRSILYGGDIPEIALDMEDVEDITRKEEDARE